MPAFAPVTIPTPTTVSAFEPVSNVGILSTYAQSLPVTTAALAASLLVSLQRPTKTSKISKGRLKSIFPASGAIAGVLTGVKDRECSIDTTVMSHERSTDAERAEAMNNHIKLLQLFVLTLVNGKSIY